MAFFFSLFFGNSFFLRFPIATLTFDSLSSSKRKRERERSRVRRLNNTRPSRISSRWTTAAALFLSFFFFGGGGGDTKNGRDR